MKFGLRLSVWVTLAIMANLSAAPAAAQSRKRVAPATTIPASDHSESEKGSSPPGYDRAIENALHEFALENNAEARSGFLEAHRLYPNARTYRALGMVEFELKNYQAAVTYLEQALASDERSLSDAQRTDAEQLLARARGYVGRYRVSLRPPSATLLIDGAVPTFEGGIVVLAVGKHLLEAEAEGHRPLHRELQVEGGEDESLDVVLLSQALARAPGREPADAPPPSTPVYKKWWFWTTLGVVVAAGAATGLVLGLRKSDSAAASGGSTNTVLQLPPGMSSGRF